MNLQSARYAPMNHAHICSFPKCIPPIDWKTYLPKFKDEKGDVVSFHLLRFHMNIHRIRVEFHEYCLMNMFMAYLEGKAISWYEKLSRGSLYSLKDFHSVFFERYKVSYPYLLFDEDCCKYVHCFIRHMENIYGDDEFMDE